VEVAVPAVAEVVDCAVVWAVEVEVVEGFIGQAESVQSDG